MMIPIDVRNEIDRRVACAADYYVALWENSGKEPPLISQEEYLRRLQHILNMMPPLSWTGNAAALN